MLRSLASMFTALALGACATPAAAPTSLDAATAAVLDEGNAAFSAAFVRGDVEAILAAYSDDAVVQTPQGTVAVSAEALRTMWAPIGRGDDRISHSLRATFRQQLAPHLILEQGAFTIVRRAEAGEQRTDGCYTLVWRRTEAGWRIQFDTWTPPHQPARSCTPR
jgi:ketosteroid isomerase-like protein